MNHFSYRDDALFCEDVPVSAIAQQVGTPFYLYSHATLTRHFKAFSDAFSGVDRIVCYSAKANSSLAILSLFKGMGSGLDIVSGGELFRGLKAGFTGDRIVYSGVGKRLDEIDFALSEGILMFNVESPQELEAIEQRAAAMNKVAPVALRINPDVDPQTHPYISTGLKKNKFGVDPQTALEAYRRIREMKHVEAVGVDCHIGSQITKVQPFKDALANLMGLIREIRDTGADIKYLDMGGGLGITYDDENPPHPSEYANAIVETVSGTPYTLILEPGRVIVGNAGILVAKVLYRKTGQTKEFVITDAAMNDLIRPSLYGAFHAVEPVTKTGAGAVTADVVGPICETGDYLAQDRRMADVKSGDLLAVMSAGAYGFAMSSNYCSRLRAAEVMVTGDAFHVIRSRQTYDDLTAGEIVPPLPG